jgi:hypothetical protein
MTTVKVQTYYGRIEEARLADFGQNVHDKLEGNPAYTNPTPTLDELQAALNAYTRARTEALEQKSPVNTEKKNIARDALVNLLSRLASYVNLTAEGDSVALLSSGFTLQTARTPVGILPAPHDLQLADGFDKGALKVTFSKVERAHGYLIAYTDDPSLPLAQWQKKLTTRIREEVTGLTRGREYHVKVAATSTEADQSETYVFSEAVSRVSQ